MRLIKSRVLERDEMRMRCSEIEWEMIKERVDRKNEDVKQEFYGFYNIIYMKLTMSLQVNDGP